MTDRELLECAAKAAGLDLATWHDEAECMVYPFRSELTDGHLWNPLLDDGDALRLAVKLKVLEHVAADLALDLGGYDDPYAVTRRAIVTAAAALAA